MNTPHEPPDDSNGLISGAMTVLGGAVCTALVIAGFVLMTRGEGVGVLLFSVGLWAAFVVVFS